MTNMRELDLGAPGNRREIQTGAGSLSGGTYFKLEQG